MSQAKGDFGTLAAGALNNCVWLLVHLLQRTVNYEIGVRLGATVEPLL